MEALLLVDVQNDFVPGGALAVPDGDAVIPVANQLMDHIETVVATQDWHPADHRSFASTHPGKAVGDVVTVAGNEQVLWPEHCVQGTRGADLAPALNSWKIQRVVQKGMDRDYDSYSGFFDNGRRRATELAHHLQEQRITALYILGLATDYCVKYTVLDARKLGLMVAVVTDGCRGVELNPGDCEAALAEMTAAGAELITSAEVLA